MTKKKDFKPKGKEELRKEFKEMLGDKADDQILDNLVERGIKDEEFKASLHKQKGNHTSGREHYKQMLIDAGLDPKTGDPVEKDSKKSDEGKKTEVDNDTKIAERVFLQAGGSKTNLRQIRKVMAATNKNFDDAQKDSLYTAFVEKQQKEAKSRGSHLNASGGSGASGNKESEMEKTMGDLVGNYLPPSNAPKK